MPVVPPAPQPHDLSRIAQDLQIRKQQVEAVVGLLDEDNTVPFITRYRKERTGGLNEDMIRRIQDRVHSLRSLADRKQTILKSIAYQGRLTDGLVEAVLAAETPKRLEDLYLPYKPKKKSKATEAREKGLGPVSEAIFFRDPAVNDLDAVVAGLVDPDKWLLNADDVMSGIRDILADIVADQADVRGPLRNFIWDVGQIAATKIETLPEGKGKEFEPYFAFKELVRDIPPHRVLAINRGEKANVLRVHLDINRDTAREIAAYHLNVADHPHRDLILTVMVDALDRLVLPSLEREVRRELTERAQDHAVLVFAKNLRSLLLQPPLRGKRVLAVDPGIRTGCKLAVLDETGKLLEDAVVYPHGQKKNQAEARRKLEQLVRKYELSVVAIGNGTGCRETEQLVADLIADLENRRLNPTPTMVAPAPAEPAPTGPAAVVESHTAAPAPASAEAVVQTHTHTPTHSESSGTFTSDPIPTTSSLTLTTDVLSGPATVETTGAAAPDAATVTTAEVAAAAPPVPKAPEIILDGLPEAPADLAYVIVIEAGASDYSASPVAREEFPNLDATTRGTISIGRRLQDPLAELVKIDPQHIGVGLYQHDVKPKHLKESLEGVIGSCVNAVGVDLNTASVPLLRHVSGMNQLVARGVIEHRERHGAFTSREQLLQVAGLGDKRFTQAAGFLKLNDSPEPLDATWIHPESYPLARQILTELGLTPADLKDKAKLDELRGKLNDLNPAEVAARLNAGEPTVRDIFDALARPGRDPREDLPPPIFKTGVLKLEDITPGMELKGTVLNVVPFGAFVDIGLKESGLVHISQMANRYIKSPYDVVAVGDVVTVWVIEVKPGEKKISLTMIAPGQERRMPPPGGGGGRGNFQGGPPRGDRPPQQQGDRQGERERPPQGDRPPHNPRGDRPPQPPRGDRPGFTPRPQGPGGPRPGGPRPGFQPRPQQQSAGDAQGEAPKPAAPPPPPRKPMPPKPLPKLTTAKKSGKAPLNTFGELAAFFKPEEAPKPPEPPAAEEPKPDTPPAS
ncbi:Tex-like N-terminal domain-containing protein [Urbifossiella limnaea]|uniref:Tex-like N-terminal domain-containing protein n=1 Tax=Urbifossiella limnaea TaxID=2528023 RepID=UPI00192E708A|nr:Tex family protein [Urbifossiella limnaea]